MQKRRSTGFDNTAIGEPIGQHRVTHSPAGRDVSLSAGASGAAVQMAREPAAIVDARNEGRVTERTRIAQEFHDTVLQGFCAASLQLSAVVESLPADSAARTRFVAVIQLVNRVLKEGRDALQGLRAPHESNRSLAEALARVPNDFGFPSDVAFRVVVLGRTRELRAEAKDDVCRIGSEAIVNAYRHSGAKDIKTEIEYGSAELRLSVRDNGCGIDSQTLQWGRNGHWGFQGMRERATRIGGRLQVLSQLALGTQVELSIPGEIVYEAT